MKFTKKIKKDIFINVKKYGSVLEKFCRSSKRQKSYSKADTNEHNETGSTDLALFRMCHLSTSYDSNGPK